MIRIPLIILKDQIAGALMFEDCSLELAVCHGNCPPITNACWLNERSVSVTWPKELCEGQRVVMSVYTGVAISLLQ
jgi:hypothetical protein